MLPARVTATISSVLLIILLSACGPAQTPVAPTATLVPTSPPSPTVTLEPALSPSPVPPTATSGPTAIPFTNLLVYDLPAMYEVNVKTVQYQTLSQPSKLLSMDIYYPPDWQPDLRLPVVVFANAFPLSSELGKCGRRCWTYPSWGRLVAASGLVAVAYDTETASDLEAVAEHIRSNGAELGIDADRLGVMGVSSDAVLAESFAYQANREFVKFAVFYYGYLLTPDNFMRSEYELLCRQINCYARELPDVEQLRTDLPVLIMQAGTDAKINVEPVNHFVELANAAGVPLTLIELASGRHGFDTSETSTGIARTTAAKIVVQTLEFMQTHAFGP